MRATYPKLSSPKLRKCDTGRRTPFALCRARKQIGRHRPTSPAMTDLEVRRGVSLRLLVDDAGKRMRHASCRRARRCHFIWRRIDTGASVPLGLAAVNRLNYMKIFLFA